MPRAFYDPSNPSTTTVYRVAEAGDPFFIPAYPVLDEEQKGVPYHSLNGTRTNIEDGSNSGPDPRNGDGVMVDATDYKAAALAQCQKIASKQAISATGVDPVTVNFQLAEGVATDS